MIENGVIEFCEHDFVPYDVVEKNPWHGHSYCRTCDIEEGSRAHLIEMELISLQKEYDTLLEKTGEVLV